jgi:class 3 adenylate cyclase
MSGAPSGTVTLLFTDVEGSTRLWDAERDAMAAALRRHDEILRSAIEHAGGYVFKTAGDSFCAAFSAARSGLDAALAAQRDLAAQSWPTSRPIIVRMGLHAGVCEERDGDYFGPAVNRAARLLTVARGGQVLVSGVAAELLSDELPDGVDLRELGTHQLKDLSRPERIYQVEAAFLAARLAVLADKVPVPGPTGLRASHADRDRVVEMLRTAAGDGRLTADDLDQRLEVALTAHTLADLEPLLADLTTVAAPEVPDLARIDCASGSAKREESWVVPRRLEINIGSGSVQLDFRQAVIHVSELRIDVQIASGSLKLSTRPGIVVDADDVTVSSGSVTVVPSAGPDAPVELRVKVSGRVGSGSVSARPARRRGRWQALWRRVLRRLAGNRRPPLPAPPS